MPISSAHPRITQQENPMIDGSGRLACPNCGHPDTHQEAATVFCREEDGPTTVFRVVQRTGDLVVNDPRGDNPSARRQGVRITFSCEGCPDPFYLSVAQHKGGTFVKVET